MFRWLLRFLIYLAGLTGLVCLLLWITGYGYILRGLRLSYLKGYTSANIYDGNDFDKRVIAKGNSKAISKSANFNSKSLSPELTKMLEQTGSTSFIVLKNDSIVYENYFRGHNDKLQSNSFSMSKTVITILTQIAIQEGTIPGWETKAKTYLPWLEGEFADKLTLRHLSCMTGGLNWDESYYNPFSITAEAYYGHELEKTMHRVKVIHEPGKKFTYQSGATQLLAMCLTKAVKKTLADYTSEKLWIPLGMEAPASWHLDHKDGMEHAYCCINAVSRDFLRLGKMILKHGKVEGKIILDSAFIELMGNRGIDTAYGQSMWVAKSDGVKWRMFQGTLGQYIIIVPSENLVIVRTGGHQKKGKRRIPDCAYTYAGESIRIFSNP